MRSLFEKCFKKLNFSFKKFDYANNIQKKDIILFGIIVFFLFSCFIYWDILATTSHTVNFLEVISQGRIFDFYKINYNFSVNGIVSVVCYEIPIYFILGLWDIPLWIAKHFFNVNITNNFLCFLWMKGILILFLYMCCKVIEKICYQVKIKEKYIKWVMLIFASSPLVLSSLLILSQYDIIPIFFMLLGILAYLKNDVKKFLLWFAIAIPMKLFSLFIFVPLLLLKEKKISKILLNSLSGLSILLVSKVISNLMPYYKLSTDSFMVAMTDKLFNSSLIDVNFGSASIFAAIFVGICIFCYIKEIKNNEELYKYSIFISFSVFMFFFLFVAYYPYWIIYVTPFFPILLFMNKKYFRINMLLEIIYSLSMLVIQTNFYSWCFGAKQVDGMLLSQLFGYRELTTAAYSDLTIMYSRFNLSNYLSPLYGIVLAVTIALIIFNSPMINSKKIKKEIKIERSVVWGRMLLIMPFALLMVLCYFYRG